MITVAGVTVPRAAIAQLAQQMHRADPRIATQLGRAIDANLPELLLHPQDAERILAVLDANPIEALEPLQQQLGSRHETNGALYVVAPPTPNVTADNTTLAST